MMMAEPTTPTMNTRWSWSPPTTRPALVRTADDMSTIQMAYHKVTVTVTDVDEDGSISLSAQQPQVGA